jgi:hypothetical protein
MKIYYLHSHIAYGIETGMSRTPERRIKSFARSDHCYGIEDINPKPGSRAA